MRSLHRCSYATPVSVRAVSKTLVLTNVESRLSPRGHGRPLHILDPCERRALAQPSLEGLQGGVVLGLAHDLDPSVGEVAGEPRNAQGLGLAKGEVAVADALHIAPDEVAVGSHGNRRQTNPVA